MVVPAFWGGWLVLLIHIIIAIAAAVLISANRKPSSAIAWVMAIIFIPLIGILFFLLVGFGRLPKHRREKQAHVSQLFLERTEGLHLTGHEEDWPDWLPTIATLNRNLGALPMVGGNTGTLLPDYHGSIQAMADAIDTAAGHVHIEFFILVQDETTQPIFDAIQRACDRGVKVRVLSDHMAQFSYPYRKQTVRTLKEMGAQYLPMLPLKPFSGHWRRPDLRNHRKLVVVDDKIGFVGSQNLIMDHYHGKQNIKRGLHWHELMVRLEGPIVREIDAVFVTDWYSEEKELILPKEVSLTIDDRPGTFDAQMVPSGPSFENDNNLKMFAAVIQNARRRISVTSPYYVPDETIQMALVTAGSRGLDVELFVSEISDQFMVFHAQRSYYEELLRAGVQIYLYPAPTVLHAKHLSIDDDVAVIGSSNMDIRSLSLHMELMVIMQSREFTDSMREIEDGYRSVSRLLTLEEWQHRPATQKVLDNLMRLTSSLM
ncbi:MAG: cardiolipin synthase [Microlunatus sp.]|nr:cardiolipin synthase [Microlunatus sp.]MDN5803612.1 cardiolipin synthase [Microlunatus sp.]